MTESLLATTSAEEALIEVNQALLIAGRITLIIVIALIVRFLLHRAIRRVTQRSVDGKMPVMLNSVRGRAREALVAAARQNAERRKQRAETIRTVLQSVVSILLFSIAVAMILGELGVNLAPILASAGIVGVALGFGAQSLVKDYLNGISIILEDQYGVGDIVDLGEAIGTIEAIGLRTTRLRDVEGVVWYVRNGEILRVANHSQGTASVVIDMPVGHGANLELAQNEMRRVLDELAESEDGKELFLAPPEVLGVQSVTPVGITLRATLTVRPNQRWSVGRRVRGLLSEAFTAAGISAPKVPFTSEQQ